MTWTRAEIAGKLAMIADLPSGELLGWWNSLPADERFPGEVAALTARAKRLNVILPSRGGH